ncbi:hypothetical protein [Halorussus lipolyticus]|uniref:hypothetical protein n=1 Tax=Halorussus lipolyticus TaxID=3034024 RepID=UPI0023E82045|nr:hypothetical protein [Halorussus sp. DT80]
MTNCYNCGHTGTFVLLVQLALAVPGPDADASDADAPDAGAPGADQTRPEDDAAASDAGASDGALDIEETPDSGGLRLAVQCPACESTDVGIEADDLLARYRSRTTS